MPAEDLPEAPLFLIPHFDKLVHLGLYLILTVLLIKPIKFYHLPVVICILIYTVLYGGGIELIQNFFTVNRSGSWYDLLSDVAGSIIGLLIYRFALRGSKAEKYL